MSEKSINQKIFDALDIAILAETGLTLNWREAVELRGYIKSLEEAYSLEGNDYRAELARRDEQIAELTATTHSQAVRNAELLRFVWWVYQVYARNVQELTSGITEACTYETEEKAEKGKYGLPI